MTAASVEAQARHTPPSACDPGPIAALIGLQDELDLDSTQVGQLERIDDHMARLNEPLVARLMEVRHAVRALGRRSEFTREQKATYDDHLDEVRPLLKEISSNNRDAMKRVGRVLTDSQRSRVGRMLDRQNNFRDRQGDGSDCFRRND